MLGSLAAGLVGLVLAIATLVAVTQIADSEPETTSVQQTSGLTTYGTREAPSAG